MTRDPLAPPPPGARPPRPGDTAYLPGEPVDAAWAARLEDEVRSLKRLAALLGLLAVAAIGIGLWALLSDDDSKGASRERVARIDDRVDRLERRLGTASEESDTARLENELQEKAGKEDLQGIQDDVGDLRVSLDKLAAADSQDEGVAKLEDRVDELAQQVDDLRRQQEP